ncbi:MAG TPA: NUDIX domain-containing protein [Steroidobacteraceae bacterium]|nr:NUDIX domain-containing protein [Steroidobacteraceae bacterium]
MARKKQLGADVRGVTTEYQGFLSIRRYEIETDRHDGGRQRVVRLIMERGHAVGVLAYDPVKDQVVLINEMRPGILAAGGAAFADALIAGVVEEHEHPLETARRETREEAGLELRHARIIHERAYVSPGGTSEYLTLVAGIVTAPEQETIHGNPDEGEDIRTSLLSPRQLMSAVKRGAINDMKTMLAAYWLTANRARLRREHAVV